MVALGQLFKERIQERILIKNKNWLAIFVGGTGSGKSYSSLFIADKFSLRGFIPKYHLVFTAEEFIEKLNNPIHIKKGDIIIFDEAGVGMSAREWQSIQNRILGAILQTFRHMNVGVIFTVPVIKFIDSQARPLFHHIFETLNIDERTNICHCKVHEFQYNNQTDKIYRKTLVFNDERGLIRMVGLAIPLPRKALIREYEEMKSKYSKNLRANAKEEIRGKKKDKEEIPTTPCDLCGSRSYEFLSSKTKWRCRKCGKIHDKNPYVNRNTPTK